MPDLGFTVKDVRVAHHAATPSLWFRIGISQRGEPCRIRNVSLQCQLRIDARRRAYLPGDQERLTDLFGDAPRWGETLHSLLWTHATVIVPAFDAGHSEVDLPVPCSFDFNIGATKYFHGLSDGHVPLELLFSGSVFYRDKDGALAVDPISWNEEARVDLPASVWQEMMAEYYPNQVFLCVNRRVFDALYDYKREHGYTGFDEVLGGLVPETRKAAAS